MTETANSLVNQIGAGVIPADEEQALLERGIKFASYWTGASGRPILIISSHENISKRWSEQMQTLYDEAHGLPVQFRTPRPQPLPVVA